MSQKKISRGVVHVHAERAPQSVVGKGPETVWSKMQEPSNGSGSVRHRHH